jgi:outer membrane protein assembly factor BamB
LFAGCVVSGCSKKGPATAPNTPPQGQGGGTGGANPLVPLSHPKGVVFITGAQGYTYALDFTTGAIKWKTHTNTVYPSGLAYSKGRLFVSSNRGDTLSEFYALNATTGAQLWKNNAGPSANFPVTDDSLVFTFSWNSTLHALRQHTGETVWTSRGPSTGSQSPTIYNGRIYFYAGADSAYCLNAANGSLVWKISAYGLRPNPPIVDGKIYGCNAAAVCHYAQTGARIWRNEIHTGTAGFVTVKNGTVFAIRCPSRVFAFDASTGVMKWYHDEWGGFCLDAGFAENNAYYFSSGPRLYALSAETGDVLWYRAMPYDLNSPVVAGNLAFVSDEVGNVHCISALNGTVMWTTYVGYPMESTPLVIDEQGVVVYPTESGHRQ